MVACFGVQHLLREILEQSGCLMRALAAACMSKCKGCLLRHLGSLVFAQFGAQAWVSRGCSSPRTCVVPGDGGEHVLLFTAGAGSEQQFILL